MKDEIEVLEVDEIDGGALIPTMEVRNLWVEIPEIQEEIRKFDEQRQKSWAETKVRWGL